MIQVSQLSKEERVEKIITEIHKKTANYEYVSFSINNRTINTN